MPKSLNTLFATAFALGLLLAGSLAGLAAEEKKKPAAGLPGVESGYSIVQPAPEPDEAKADDSDGGKRFKAGNWDVEISGYIWYQVGASSNGR